MSRYRHFNRVVALVLCCSAAGVAAAFTLPAAAQTEGRASAQVKTGQVALSHTMTLRDLPIASGPSGLRPMTLSPRSLVPDSEFAMLKAQAAARRGTATDAAAATTPALPSTNGRETVAPLINFDGDNQREPACQDAIPGDPALAVGDGANPILHAVNQCASVWNAAGMRLAGPVKLQALFGLPAGTAVNGPRALYDWYNHRFIVVAADTDHASSNNYDIAVSKTDDPAGAYCIYRIPVQLAGNAYPDFLRLGQDHTAPYPTQSGTAYPGTVYLAANLFANPNGAFLYEQWLLLPKQRLYNCQDSSFSSYTNIYNPDNTVAFSSQPANVWSPFDIPRAGFFLESYSNGGNKLVAFAISNPWGWVSGGPNPEFSSVEVNTAHAYTIPPDADQPGAPNSVDTGDTRISGQVTYNAGYLHAALTSGSGLGSSFLIVYKVLPTLDINDDANCTGSYANACPKITAASVERETVKSYNAGFAYYPTPVPDLEGNIVTVFNFSSGSGACASPVTGCFPSVGYLMQRATAGNVFFDEGQYLQPGGLYWSQQRWGRYTAVAPVAVGYQAGSTPGRPGMAFSGMYTGACLNFSTNCWLTRIGYAQFDALNQP